MQNYHYPPDSGDCCFDLLPDDLIASIGYWVANYTGVENLIRFQKTCLRTRTLLRDPEFIDNVIGQQQGASESGVTNLEQLGLYETILKEQPSLLKDNRIGFEFASIDIDDNGGIASGIKGSWDRIESVRRAMKKFPNSTARIDAHCGLAAPAVIARRFSEGRGIAVVGAVVFDGDIAPSRVNLHPWGVSIALAASESKHTFGEHARSGKGWVDLTICLRGGDDNNNDQHLLELPNRPSYYQGVRPEDGEDENNRSRLLGAQQNILQNFVI